MEKWFILFAVLAMTVLSTDAQAGNSWYRGQLDRVVLHGDSEGSFLVQFANGSLLDDCHGDYAYFITSEIGINSTKAALTIALSALASGSEFGVILDTSIDGDPAQPNTQCYARGMIADIQP